MSGFGSNVFINSGPKGSGRIQMGMGMSGTEVVKKEEPSVNAQYEAIIQKAHRMGVTHEIRDLSEQVDEMRKVIRRKNYELDVLEMLALESDDDNVTTLREQLFATVKLIHNDLVDELLKDFYDGPQPESEYDDYHTAMPDAKPRPFDKKALLNRARQWYYQRTEIRRQMKHVKKVLESRAEHGDL